MINAIKVTYYTFRRMFRRLLSNYPKYTLDSKQYFKYKVYHKIRPYEIAEQEEKELTKWGEINEKDTGLDDVEHNPIKNSEPCLKKKNTKNIWYGWLL